MLEGLGTRAAAHLRRSGLHLPALPIRSGTGARNADAQHPISVHTMPDDPIPALLQIMLDTNAIDALTDDDDALRLVNQATDAGRLRLLVTHVQDDEIARIPDPDRRLRRKRLATSVVPTSVFVLDVSRLEMARLGDGRVYDQVQTDGLHHAADGIIADTAAAEGLPVVTADRRLRARCRALGIEVFPVEELLQRVRGIKPMASQRKGKR